MAQTQDKPESLERYEVLLCATGGIACYKAADLASKLVAAGAGVTVAMTDSARRFITPLTFAALTGRECFTSLWSAEERYCPHHISLTERADLMVVAPGTANIIAKLAGGLADELVSTLAMAASGACPILLAPAMNVRMWSSPALQENLKRLVDRGVHVVGPNEGRLACGTVGMGRMAEPVEILRSVGELLLQNPPKNL